MLLAVEGSFISSSAAGYSKGIAFLLFGRRDEDKPPPMRVLPWTPHNHPHRRHYRLFTEEIDSTNAMAPLDRPPKSSPAKIRPGCARFLLCLAPPPTPSPGRATSLTPLRVESDGSSLRILPSGCNIGGVASHRGHDPVKFLRKSSLKKTLPVGGGGEEIQETDDEKEKVVFGTATKMKVQWTDVHRREFTEIREFEPRNGIHALRHAVKISLPIKKPFRIRCELDFPRML